MFKEFFVSEAMEFGEADNDLLTHCQKFFHSFVQSMTSVKAAIHGCRVNMWTFFRDVRLLSQRYRSSEPEPSWMLTATLCEQYFHRLRGSATSFEDAVFARYHPRMS